ncbi:zinc finger protein 28-like [Anopheles albimanus]|uniref:zinc finger protein 28-like n=1 Tax=Anopheles albimanus TaxID=7167 RepID=UPI00163F43DB|nr:zinc finger protein 28-like [Anopheles albimanus]
MESGVSICSLCLQNKLLLEFACEDSKKAATSVVACYFLFEQNIIPKHQICITCWQQLTAFDHFSNQVKLAHELYFKQGGTYFSYVAEGAEKAAPGAAQQSIGEQVELQEPDHNTSQIWAEERTNNISEASTTLSGSERDELVADATQSQIEGLEELTEDIVADIVGDSNENSQRDVVSQTINDLCTNGSQMLNSFNESEIESEDDSGDEILRMTQTDSQELFPECRNPTLLDANDWQETTIAQTQSLNDYGEPEYLDDSDGSENSDVSVHQQPTKQPIETETEVPIRNTLQQESRDDVDTKGSENSHVSGQQQQTKERIETETEVPKTNTLQQESGDNVGTEGNENSHVSGQQQQTKERIGTETEVPKTNTLQQESGDNVGTEGYEDCHVSGQQEQTKELIESETEIPTTNNSQPESDDEENSILDMILMDIDNDIDTDKAEDASDKSNLSARSSVQENRRTDELISQHCNLDCAICGAKSSTFLQVMRHFQTQHNKKGYIMCCGELYTVRRNLLDHVVLQNDPNAFSCSQCSQSYLSTTAYRAHLSTHRKPAIIYTCEVCGKQFPKRLLLMIHRKHHDAYKCDQCDANFTLRRELQEHKIEHQDANIDETNEHFVCKVCSKSYESKEAARRHYANTHGPVRYMCESCPESFKSYFGYFYHKNTKHSDTNVKPVQCNICERWLKSVASLRKHMFLHETNKKPLVCDICGKVAKHPQSLRSHKRYVHAKECPFECLICKKAFVREKALKEHMAVHTGESLYQCSFCPQTFNSGANMHAHRKKKHPAELEEQFKQRSDNLRAIYEQQNGQISKLKSKYR